MLISEFLNQILMVKQLSIIAILFLSGACFAAPMGKLPIMVSRANCPFVSPLGVGNYNESLSYYVNDSHDMWVRSAQRSAQGTVRIDDSALGYLWQWRAYAGFVDKGGAQHTKWTVNGHHATRFSLVNIHTAQTSATNCNAGQGWPWTHIYA